MPVNNDHLKDTVMTWDGIEFKMMKRPDAVKLEKQGVLQITKGVRSKDLKFPVDFEEARAAQKARAVKAKAKVKPKAEPEVVTLPGVDDQSYKTREMKAETK